MAIHRTIIPDCPECGRELHQVMYYKPQSQTHDNPYGVQLRFWSCTCGWESVHVENDEWDELTYRLVLGTEEA